VVLLHGHPRTHTTWHRVAPQLSGSFFVVCPDLRGYGKSTLPPYRTRSVTSPTSIRSSWKPSNMSRSYPCDAAQTKVRREAAQRDALIG